VARFRRQPVFCTKTVSGTRALLGPATVAYDKLSPYLRSSRIRTITRYFKYSLQVATMFISNLGYNKRYQDPILGCDMH
jgi:hypothetical protein